MAASATLVLTGARGNLGGKLATALSRKYALRCLDLLGGDDCVAADLAIHDDSWTRQFAGAHTVLHFAGEPQPTAPWAMDARHSAARLSPTYSPGS